MVANQSFVSCFRFVNMLVGTLVLFPNKVAGADTFPQPHNSETDHQFQRLDPEQASKQMQVPDGFQVDVFAAEPDVQNPIDMAWDSRGRLWIAENYTYEKKKHDLTLRDRIVIFTDVNGDGQAEKRRVFTDTIQGLTSVEVGLGGVWLMCPPQLLFVPDRNGDDVPDGPAEIVLDGFHVPRDNYHNFANGLRWGPDGWLYGRCGASSPGMVRRPDQPPEKAVPNYGGIWRYRPRFARGDESNTRHDGHFEVLCHGTTNPWGLDWNDHGEAFFVNTVNGHLWHLIPGAHFRRPHTISPNRLVYEPIEMHADHWHWDTGQAWHDSRGGKGEHGRLGGGHAHSGAMIYLGSQWPSQYRDQLLTLNFHGRRANVEKLTRHGDGYLASHQPDILFSADPWFRGIELSYGPDGAVYVLDWSDTGECHENTGVHRTSGRIFRVSYSNSNSKAQNTVFSPMTHDLTQLDANKLVDLHRHTNEWYVRMARRELANRSTKAVPIESTVSDLSQMVTSTDSIPLALRGLWTLHTLAVTSDQPTHLPLVRRLLEHPSDHLRAWALRLLSDSWPLDTVIGSVRAGEGRAPKDLFTNMKRLARNDESGLIRLVLASTLQRLPLDQRTQLAAELVGVSKSSQLKRRVPSEHNVPKLIWYGMIPVSNTYPEMLWPLAIDGRIPLVTRWISRRLAELAATGHALHRRNLNQLVQKTNTATQEVRLTVVKGMAEGFAGQHKLEMPPAWPDLVKSFGKRPSAEARSSLRTLEVFFGSGRALEDIRAIALDDKVSLSKREAALRTLIEARSPDIRNVCEKLLKVRFLNSTALHGLATINDPTVGRQLAQNYQSFHPSERPAVIDTLVSRPSFAVSLLEAMADGNIQRSDVSAFQARQIHNIGNAELTKQLTESWGEYRESPQDKQRMIDRLKKTLDRPTLASADTSRGRAVFAKTCANCHRMFGSGGTIGPDITGANRRNLDYLLSNLIDPSAVVNKDFQISVFRLDDGRVINGIVMNENETTLTIQTAKERETILKSEIKETAYSHQSLMPDGQLQALSGIEQRDLIAYLMSEAQVPLP